MLLAKSLSGGAAALDSLTVGTSRPAGVEQSGYYAAIADGSYRKYGLEVTIRRLDPGTDPAALVASGEIDFSIDGNCFRQLALARREIPVVSIAAIFQKDPIAVLTHPGAGVSHFEDLRGRALYLSVEDRSTVWPWLRRRYGLDEGRAISASDRLVRFLADPVSVEIGDVIAETLAIRSAGGIEPRVLLPADDVYYGYERTVQASQRLIGMSAVELDQALAAIKKHGVVDSGHVLSMGIGAMDGGHWVNFWKSTLGRLGREHPDFDLLYSLQFVNQGHGLALKDALLGG